MNDIIFQKAMESLAKELRYLGNGDAGSTMGAIEGHSVAVEKVAEAIRDQSLALREIAEALRGSKK